VAALATEPSDLADRDAGDSDALEGVFDSLECVRLDDRGDE
jgi:hypothetical protein